MLNEWLDRLPWAVIAGAVIAALRRIRFRGIISVLSANIERETYRQMVEHEKMAGQYWMVQAQECQKELDHIRKGSGRGFTGDGTRGYSEKEAGHTQS